MQVRPDQLEAHLRRDLAAVYVVCGDEPLQHAEATDAIRAAARERGHAVREVYEAGGDFDWGRLAGAASSLSLFADRRLIDLRIPSGKPGRDGGTALRGWTERPPEDTVLLVTLPKLDRQATGAAWFRALADAGVVVMVYPPDRAGLPEWIGRRMRDRGLQPDAEAVALVAERVEGNLLAAAQEIDKLTLLIEPGPVNAAQVAEAVAESARYNAFDLGDAMLAGDVGRVGRIVTGLRGEGTPPPLIFWAVHRELSQLAAVAARCASGESTAAAMRALGVWERRQPLVRAAVERFDVAGWDRLLVACARLDRVAKGAQQGSFWDELVELALIAAGAPLPEFVPRRTASTLL